MKNSDSRSPPSLIHIQSFHSVAKHGSLGAAVRADGGSVPTLSRHISALEEMYRVLLFDRRGDGLSLTQTGAKLFQHAEAVRNAGREFDAAASGTTSDIGGVVRISASRLFANFVLPEIIAGLGIKHPEIEFDLVVTDLTSNLLMREADIALRMFRPEQASLFAKQVGTIRLGAYASKAYVERKGAPSSFVDLQDHDIIGDDNSDQINRELEDMGIEMTKDFFRYRCSDPSVAWRLVLEGAGIGLCYTTHAKQYDGLVRVLDHAPEMTRPIWLTSHAELKTSSTVRTVFDFLAAEIQAKLTI